MPEFDAVVLVGHGGLPADVPTEMVSELKRLESARQREGTAAMSAREAELDGTIRAWPRTPRSDPYQAGLEALAARLRARLGSAKLVTAYNEFCAPSLEDAVATLVADGAHRIGVVTTMLTPGGSHSELEIPQSVSVLSDRYPEVDIEYLWPYDLDRLADFLCEHLSQRR